jgi:heat shock protein HtpX
LIEKKKIRKHRLINALQTVLFLVMVVGLLCIFAYLLFGALGSVITLTVMTIFFFFGSNISPNMVLRLYGARELSPREAPGLYRLVDELSHRASISSRVQLYCIEDQKMNAFSTGNRSRPCIAFSTGLLSILNEREVRGVMAHEFSHLIHGDIKIMVLSQLIGKLVSFFSFLAQFLILINIPFILSGQVLIPFWFILMALVAPTGILLLQLKLFRIREYDADLTAAELTDDPEGLAQALHKIGQVHKGLFSFFGRFRRRQKEPPEWLSSHPPSKERIKRLMALNV